MNYLKRHGSSRSGAYSRGFMAITLVLWTTIGLSSLLYMLLESYQYLLINISTARQNASARSAAIFCRDIVLSEFIRDADYKPLINRYISIPIEGNIGANIKCGVTGFNSSFSNFTNKVIINNEIVTIGKYTGESSFMVGAHMSSTSVSVKTRFSISDDLVEPFKFLYTVEI